MDPTQILTFINALSLSQFLLLVLGVTFVDFIVGAGKAITTKTFSLAQVAEFLGSHVVQRVIPLFALGYVGHAMIPGLDAQASAAAAGLAGLGLATYIVETYGSLRDTLTPKTPPTP